MSAIWFPHPLKVTMISCSFFVAILVRTSLLKITVFMKSNKGLASSQPATSSTMNERRISWDGCSSQLLTAMIIILLHVGI
jgi:hypothetical protein